MRTIYVGCERFMTEKPENADDRIWICDECGAESLTYDEAIAHEKKDRLEHRALKAKVELMETDNTLRKAQLVQMVSKRKCPSCGAPYTAKQELCKYCRTPLVESN